jgi:prepilin-type processing-associated H-X9-DG protein
VTDSFIQGMSAGAGFWDESWGDKAGEKPFEQSIAINGYSLIEKKMAAIQDAANYVVCADGGANTEGMNPGLVAYADLCNAECGNCYCSGWIEECWDTVSAGDLCGLGSVVSDCFLAYHTSSTMLKDQNLMKKGERHLGGSNIGFADGHASWMSSQRFLDKWADEAKPGTSAMGLDAWGPVSWCISPETGEPFATTGEGYLR